MSDDVFDGQMLADKLFKLNSSQQSINSLSTWVITQRKKAKQIVEIWHKSFKSGQGVQHVSFLYLANDILQNSRREGHEFVNEFWKVMPSALKHVNEHGDENGKKTASRLVDIWDQRKVFGSRGQNLKEEMLGKSKTQLPNNNGKTTSNPIKIVKRDSNSLRLKLAVGGTPEKIITAFHSVHDENATEDTALNNCESVVRRFGDLERDIETQGVVLGSSLVDEIQVQENVLEECVNQLETAEKTRISLVSHLKEALQDQELKLDVIHSQLQVARNQIEFAANLKKKLSSIPAEVTGVDNQSISFGTTTTTHVTEEENKKAAAAAVAAKLAASTSSAQMLTSVLSSLVAQEAASLTNNLFPLEKRQKLDPQPPISLSDFTTSFQPPPSVGGNGSPANQFVQYGYNGASSLPPPPPPLPPHVSMGMMMLNHMPPQQPPYQQQSQPPQSTGGGGYYRPPGIGFYQ